MTHTTGRWLSGVDVVPRARRTFDLPFLHPKADVPPGTARVPCLNDGGRTPNRAADGRVGGNGCCHRRGHLARDLSHSRRHGPVPRFTRAAGCSLVRHGRFHAGRSTLLYRAGRPQSSDGGEYVYLRRGFGRRVAFLYGWMAAVVMYPGVAAALCVGTVPYIQALVPVPARFRRGLPALTLLPLGSLNYSGTRLSSRVMTALNWLKIPVLAALVGWALVSRPRDRWPTLPRSPSPLRLRSPRGAIAGAAISAFFCFGGWWEAGKIAGQVRNPSRTLPIAFTGGVLMVTAIYLLVSFAFVAVVPMEQIQSNTAFVAQFGQALFGAAGGRVLSACVALRARRPHGAQHGGAPRDLCSGPRRSWRNATRDARRLRPHASALGLAGECGSAADRDGSRESSLLAHSTAFSRSSSFPQSCFWR